MSENDQYPAERHGTKTPVAILLVVAIGAAVGAFVYGRSDTATDRTITGGIAVSPNRTTPVASSPPAP
ncbi:hypothetical protein [Aureimonas leprariae]|uniref:hypothetical protein n=1 Tax=Plantimonas leprariae TaxID=2615207 RepID=UPI0012477D81|nr:hypothetical protein [Aureimonas leprariae]